METYSASKHAESWFGSVGQRIFSANEGRALVKLVDMLRDHEVVQDALKEIQQAIKDADEEIAIKWTKVENANKRVRMRENAIDLLWGKLYRDVNDSDYSGYEGRFVRFVPLILMLARYDRISPSHISKACREIANDDGRGEDYPSPKMIRYIKDRCFAIRAGTR